MRACQRPTTIWASSTASRRPVHRRSRSAAGVRHEPIDEDEREREQGVCRPRVHVLHELGVQPVARRTAVAGVRPGSGHEDPDDDRDQHERARVSVRQEAYQRGTARTRGPGTAYTRATSTADERDQRDRGEVVQSDDVGVEVRQHGDSADDRLERHVQPDDEREPEQIAALRAASARRTGTSTIATMTSTKVSSAVAELDDAVDAHLRRVTSEPGVHCGHVGQPRPEPVRRTSPPVPTMPTWTTSVAQAAAMTRRSTSSGQPSARASARRGRVSA